MFTMPAGRHSCPTNCMCNQIELLEPTFKKCQCDYLSLKTFLKM